MNVSLPLTADIVLKALRTLKVLIPDKFSTPGSIVIYLQKIAEQKG